MAKKQKTTDALNLESILFNCREYLRSNASQIKCETKEIFEQFRLNFYKEFPQNDQKKLFELSSKEIFATFDAKFANDLFEPALMANPKLQEFAQDGWFFSGSGSSFFRIK